MQSVVRDAQGGAHDRIFLLACSVLRGRLRSRVVVAAAAAVALVGCAPQYREVGDAMFDAADAGAPSRPRSKTRIPVPSRALLTPQAEPRCEETKTAAHDGGHGPPQPAKSNPKRMASTDAASGIAKAVQSPEPSAASAGTAPPNLSDPNAGLARRIKLEYERECYRQAEVRARNRLHQLQDSVGATIKAVNRIDQQSR